MTHQVTIRYSDGAVRAMPVAEGQTVLEAAEAAGVPVVSECEAGVCGTCVGRCTKGKYRIAHSIGLSQPEKDLGRILTCQTRVDSDCEVELDYPMSSNAAHIVVGPAVVTRVERLSSDTALLALDVSGLPEKVSFKPGQYAQLKVPGTGFWRSYSFAHAARADDCPELEFLVRLLPDGAMSDYLRDQAKPGDRLDFRASKGSFYAREASRPVVLMAGGTGLSAILAIAEQLVRDGCSHPIRLNYGVTHAADLVLVSRIERLARQCANFSWGAIVREASPDWKGPVGVVTDLLSDTDLNGGDVDLYLCGPAVMVDATRSWLHARGIHQANLYYEKFTASGSRDSKPEARLDTTKLDLASVKERGRGTAIVIGGSIAGITTAKVLTEKFKKVIILEKDQDHRKMEGRPGAAQGWHLHHLLMAGQQQIETVFPGIIDDMVEAGAFKVDMGEQYRLMLGGSWKKVVQSGLDVVCAGRPLLEWCVRRRIDGDPAIEYRYESNVSDLVHDKTSNTVLGVVVRRGGEQEVVPAEFVVDAAGKNTPVPALLEEMGIGAPRIEEDHINCFYSTMMFKVPPERAWRDKVMVITYAHRPYQLHYSAQFYTDTSRSVLCTTLVGYNCYSPPRNVEEFREFARRMPSQGIRNEIDGLEPCSEVHNFRYPTMQRYHYQEMRNLPAGLVSLGDSFCSADPVSGAGMTKALLELAQLRTLLRSNVPRDHAFVRQYYKNMCGIADLVWFVIREQNLRYRWIKDVDKKRSFYANAQNWYIDRMIEAMHDDPDLYRIYLSVTHFVAPPTVLFQPSVLRKVLGKWLRTRLSFGQTLIERNFGDGRMGDSTAPIP
jgi:NAD(P)H-flavin reductase/2-polyprenyl-6-methoxyphenol hydroxylase-like FAD-dependent oxidoreductase